MCRLSLNKALLLAMLMIGGVVISFTSISLLQVGIAKSFKINYSPLSTGPP
jgi:hypothetical protein